MPRRIVIIQGHPDPDRHRLCHALADAHAAGADEAGPRRRHNPCWPAAQPVLAGLEPAIS